MMIAPWCSTTLRWCPVLAICRVVVVVAVLVLAVVLAARGYAPGTITAPVLMVVAGAVAAADRLVDGRPVRPVPARSAS